MNSPLMMVAAVLFPVAALGLVLWLTRLEETLPRAVPSRPARAGAAPDPRDARAAGSHGGADPRTADARPRPVRPSFGHRRLTP